MRATNSGGVGVMPSAGVLRGSLVEIAVQSPYAAVLLMAPPGYGKTSLARQIASVYETAAWVDARESDPDATRVGAPGGPVPDGADSLTGASSVSHLPHVNPGSACLVIDNLNRTDADTIRSLVALIDEVSARGWRTVVACRGNAHFDAMGICGFELMDTEDLRMSLADATALSRQLGYEGGPDQVEQRWVECRGHPGFLSALFRSQYVADNDLANAPRRLGVRLSTLLAHLVNGALAPDELHLFTSLWLLGKGNANDLRECGVKWTDSAIRRLETAVPLIGLGENGSVSRGALDFSVHPGLSAAMDESHRLGLIQPSRSTVVRVAEHLTVHGNPSRAARLYSIHGDDAAIAQVCALHGHEIVAAGSPELVDRLVGGLSLSRVMSDAGLLLVWSDALHELDRYEESLAKARAAMVIAQHHGDGVLALRAQSLSIDSLRTLGRTEEAAQMARAIVRPKASMDSSDVLGMLSAGKLLVCSGDYANGRRMLQQVIEEPAADPGMRGDAQATLAIVPALAEGDFVQSASALSMCAVSQNRSPGRLTVCKGNLASALLETGRVVRCAALIEQVVSEGGELALSSFLPVLGCVRFSEGNDAEGLELVARGIRKAQTTGVESGAAQSRVYEAMLLRGAGCLEESLSSAERAHERLSVQDLMGFRSLARLEVAASLLALGDVSAARAWSESVETDGYGANMHHAFRGAMVLALCDAGTGRSDEAVARLRDHAAHLRSGNSNFQGAMYCRAFPELLGLFAESFGASEIPSHLLRLIPGKFAEPLLRNCRSNLSDAEWTLLGERLMGPEQFNAFIERRGFPMCRVRMFGGFEVSIDGRTVQEREWKKRKARMLFAMLVAGRGREFAREQIFDTLWPELTEERAKNNFYVAWSAMKGALSVPESASGPCPYADNSGGRCRIVVTAVRSDLDDFEESRQAAREAETSGDIDAAIAAYDLLAAAYSGDLMAGDPYDEWIQPLRDRYRTDFVEAMLRLGNLLLERDDPCEALPYLRRAMEVSLYREDVCQAALRCHIAAGQRGAAVDTFMACKSQLSEELGLDPSADTLALYQQILVMEDRPRYDDYGLT